MASLMIIAAEDHIPMGESRAHFETVEEMEDHVQRAIERARDLIANNGILNVVITAGGSVMGVLRWNLEAPGDPPIEMIRFEGGLVLC